MSSVLGTPYFGRELSPKIYKINRASRTQVYCSLAAWKRISRVSLLASSSGTKRRDVSAGAGKKKRVSPGGRFDGPRKPKDLGPSPEVINKVLAEADIVYNDDYYKYGAYGPYRHRGLVLGEPQFGSLWDKDMVFLYSSVRDDEEMEGMHKYQQCRIFDKKLSMMESGTGKMQFFYVFVRGTQKPQRWQPPWKMWTLAAHVVVESAEKLDKWDVGEKVDLRARHGVTRCVSWCRPDLIWVKRPSYQMRYEPQENYMRHLFELLNPETELNGIEGETLEERKKKTFYYKLCEKLGVQESASEAEIVAAFVGLDDERKSLVLEHMLNGQPVQFLYPFTKAWRRKEAEAAALGREVKPDGGESLWDDEEQDGAQADDLELEHGEDENEDDGDELEDDEDDDDDEDDAGEVSDGELQAMEMELEKYDKEQVENYSREFDENDIDDDEFESVTSEDDSRGRDQAVAVVELADGVKHEQGARKKRIRKKKDTYFGGKPHPLRRKGLTSWQRDFYREVTPSYAALRRYPRELHFHHFDALDDDPDESKNWNFEEGTGLKAAVRPFTYQDMLEEIVFIRRQYVCYN